MKRTAFTLLELLIVLAILIVLIGIIGRSVWTSYEKAMVRSTKIQINGFEEALRLFQMDNKRYPTSAEGLDLLVGKVNTAPQSTEAGAVTDPMAVPGTTGNTGMDPMGMGGTGMDPMGMGGTGMDPMGMGGTGTMPGANPQGMGQQDMGMGGMADPMGMDGGMGDGMGVTGTLGTGNNTTNGNTNNGNTTTPAAPRSYGKYMDDKDIPMDAWGNAFKYEWPTNKGNGKKPAIWSLGPNKTDDQGKEDDIISWDPNETVANPQGANGQGQTMDPMNPNGMNGGMGNGMQQNQDPFGAGGMGNGMQQNQDPFGAGAGGMTPNNQQMPMPNNQQMPMPNNQQMPMPNNQQMPMPNNQQMPMPNNPPMP